MFDKNLIEKPQPDKEGKAEKFETNRYADGIGYAVWMNYSKNGLKRCYKYRISVETKNYVY